MTASRFFRPVAGILLGALVLSLPLVREDGFLLMVAVVAGYTALEGARSRAVYVSLGLLILSDVVYGSDPGVAPLAYIGAVLLLRGVQRFIAVSAWSSVDGWRPSDMLRCMVLAFTLYAATVTLTVLIGDMLFGYDHVAQRVRLLWTVHPLTAAVVTCVCAVIMLRRLTVPFRRPIRFGI